jgi:dihydrofolate reductase
MRKLIIFNMLTLDGFFEGPKGEIDWHNVDEEFNEFADEQLGSADLLVFGRVTYEGMASYWPTEAGLKDDPIIADRMNKISKLVISRTLKTAEWQNTRLVKENVAEEFSKLKEQTGKNMFIFGSANLGLSLTKLGLIDEYRIIINPVVLGQGKSMFEGIGDRLYLKLISTRNFKSGNVLLSYESVKR